jgi:hypothetical protein
VRRSCARSFQPVYAAEGIHHAGFDKRRRQIHESARDVNCHEAPQDGAGAADLHSRVHAALESRVCIGKRRRLHNLRTCCSESGMFSAIGCGVAIKKAEVMNNPRQWLDETEETRSFGEVSGEAQ